MKAICVLVFCSLLAFAQQPPKVVENQPTVFTVHPEILHQKIVGFGAGLYHGIIDGEDKLSAEKQKELYDAAFAEQGLRLNIVRFNVSPLAEELPADSPLRKAGQKYDWGNDKYTQALWKALEPVLLRVQKPVLYAVPFTPPTRWKTNNQLTFGGSVPAAHYHSYAEYLADFIDYYKSQHRLDIDVISLQNEPDVSVVWESCRWTGEELRDFLKVVGEVFQNQHLHTQIMIPEGSTWDETWIRAEPSLQDPQALRFIGILASHTYGDYDLVDKGRGLLTKASLKFNLPVWMSETSVIGPPDDPSIGMGLRVAHTVYRDLVEGNASAWIYCFLTFTSKFPGSMGIVGPVRNGDFGLPKRYWSLANYSSFVRPGWHRIEVEGLGFANSAFLNPEADQVVIVGINATINARPATYQISKSSVVSVHAYRTSSTENLKKIDSPSVFSGGFSATLLPFSVTTFVVDLKH